jgi:hypothetical protein
MNVFPVRWLNRAMESLVYFVSSWARSGKTSRRTSTVPNNLFMVGLLTLFIIAKFMPRRPPGKNGDDFIPCP